jgi:hypothetical protein
MYSWVLASDNVAPNIILGFRLIKDWLGLQGIHPRNWATLNIKEWWALLADGITPQRKALASLSLLTV